MKQGFKRTKESIEKQFKSTNVNKDKLEIKKMEIIKKIQEESRENLLPTLRDKMNELSNYIVDVLKQKGEDVSNIQVMSLIARRSISEIVGGSNIPFTPQEIMAGFNLYLDMIEKINEIKKFPKAVESFSIFMGISRSTYNSWLVDPSKKDVMDYIHSYLLGMQEHQL